MDGRTDSKGKNIIHSATRVYKEFIEIPLTGLMIVVKISILDFHHILLKIGTKVVHSILKPNPKLFFKNFEFVAQYGMSD